MPLAVALCRAGFEAEAAADVAALCGARPGAMAPGATAYVASTVPAGARALLARSTLVPDPAFVRSLFEGSGPHTIAAPGTAAGRADRVTPLLAALDALSVPSAASLWVEYPDTNDGKGLTALARALEARLLGAWREQGRVDPAANLRLHVLLVDGATAFVGASRVEWGSPWPLGIPRLSMPGRAPSRSTLKLAEAFKVFLGAREATLLRPGLTAVDLGAAPGGWTWQLAQRGLVVTAVDNGALKGDVAIDPRVTHRREDGLTWRPRKPVDWLVCDIVEQPRAIAALMADWIARRQARRAIFNLKLPMRKRHDELALCRGLIEARLADAGIDAEIRFRQLYHDREEVTGCILPR